MLITRPQIVWTLCKNNWFFFFSSRRRHTRLQGDWSSDVCSSDLSEVELCQGMILLGRLAIPLGCLSKILRPSFGSAVFQSQGELRLGVSLVRLVQIGRASCRERV